MTLSVPGDPTQALKISTNTSVEVNLLTDHEMLKVRGVEVDTTQSNVKFAFASVMEEGMSLRTVSGQITARDFTVNGKGSVGVDSKAVVSSELGQVELQNVSLVECDLEVATGAGTVYIVGVERYALMNSPCAAASREGGCVCGSSIHTRDLDPVPQHCTVGTQSDPRAECLWWDLCDELEGELGGPQERARRRVRERDRHGG